jgi:hypothetical protein
MDNKKRYRSELPVVPRSVDERLDGPASTDSKPTVVPPNAAVLIVQFCRSIVTPEASHAAKGIPLIFAGAGNANESVTFEFVKDVVEYGHA